jgi:uncharacterized membrane protein YfcA
MLVVLTLVAFLTATISGIIGMGGGTLLLAAMFCFLSHGEAVPLHAAVQLVSNGSRLVVFFKSVDWPIVGRFALGMVPGVILAGVILWSLGRPGRSEPYLKILVGAYILALTFLPRPQQAATAGTRRGFTLLGLVAGTAGLTVGAIGPIIAPLFARRGLVQERLIATKATCQMSTHLLKISAFWLLGRIEFAKFSALLLAMAGVTVLGTLLGKRILKDLSPQLFIRLYQIALTLAGLKVLIFDGLLQLPGSP